ncbi:ERI1 exoribonuclease 3 [Microplitis mediator]|uniref:ERI1 exoribonuclease 3 n=1 Tax=Microplitis mediator TaxID=375433 RepID=UPI002555D894|nr:ERI1 exoribonuclease 3 [Microplitis mediator]
MALRFMKKVVGPVSFGRKTPDDVVQKFKYLLVLDFEATCEKHVQIKNQEIIEFPCVAVSTKNWEIESIFHEYVKPRVNPIISPFCTELTGIMQETIENEEYFPVVLDKFSTWLATNNFIKDIDDNNYNNNNNCESTFVTCGDWDLKVMLPNQCNLDDLPVPHYFNQWIDLKKIFHMATQYYPKSLRDMLNQLDLPMQGRLHSGIHDSLNMKRIIETIGNKYPVKFDYTSRAKTIID